MDDDVAEKLANLSPRQLRAVLLSAFGRAARAGRRRLITADIVTNVENHHPSIGFIKG